MEKEIRSMTLENLETKEENNDYIVGGYINKYNQRSQLLYNERTDGYFYEEIRAGAFDNSLNSNRIIPCLFNHDNNKILGSTRSGSLKLESDDIGLKFELRINKNISYANDTYELIKSGDIAGCSFGFMCDERDCTWKRDSSNIPLRSINKLDLYEVTLTPYPAYESSQVSCRSYENFINLEKKSKEEELRKRKLEIELELEE